MTWLIIGGTRFYQWPGARLLYTHTHTLTLYFILFFMLRDFYGKKYAEYNNNYNKDGDDDN